MRSCLLSFALAVCCTSQAAGVDLTKIDRSIQKQPEYSGSPRYALLAFGDQAKTRVWLVRDAANAYVDRNGNGDLTEAGERFSLGSGRSSISINGITEAGGKRHTSLYLYFYNDDRFRLRINIAKRGRQTVGWGKSSYPKPRLAKRPEDAPVLHLNGPLTLGRYGPMSILPRQTAGHSYRLTWLRLLVGSRGVGHGTFAGYTCGIIRCSSGYRRPTAEIEFPARDPDAKPIRVTQALEVKG